MCSEKIERQAALGLLRMRVLAEATSRAERLRHPQAKRHLKEGFNKRLLMMEVATTEIALSTKSRQDRSLTPYKTAQLTLYLNSYYLNLRGAVDNLSWAIAFEHNLMLDLDESSIECQRFCNLFGRRFRESLAQRYPNVYETLGSLQRWYTDLKTLRDPAAHRIPLSFPSSVLFKDDGERWHALQSEAQSLAREASEALQRQELDVAGQLLDASTSLQFEAAELGQFLPVIVTSEVAGHEVRSAPDQLTQDQSNFLTLAHAVVVGCFP